MSRRNEVLTVPARCRNGHELTARTTTITVTGEQGVPSTRRPVRWTCVRCVRLDCWHAHYDRHTDPAERGRPIPADELAETRYQRQAGWMVARRPAAWTKRVHFASGWGYDREDPTPELRQAIREAREKAERDREADKARQDREAANADLLALCRGRGAA